MSVEGRSADGSAPGDVAAAVRSAGFVRLVARADGDALAAAGLLARACETAGVPFQVSVAATDGDLVERLDAADGLAVAVGADAPTGDDAITADEGPTSVTAAAVADELGGADPVLALAGVVAAGETPGTTPELLERAERADAVERRPGLAVPTADLADGLAHSTLVHAGFSARPAAAEALVDAADASDAPSESARRELGSLVAVEAAGEDAATERGATALERALRPQATPADDSRFATLGGYADVLDALARAESGTGVALALGSDVREAALSAWRDHARAAHEGLRGATTGRYDGLFVARVEDAPVVTTARLLADFRSPEPVGMAVTDGEAAAVATPGAAAPTAALRDAAADLGGDAGPVARGGYARFDGTAPEFITAFREAS